MLVDGEDQNLEDQTQATESDASESSQSATQEGGAPNQENQAAGDLFDLDSAEKVRFKGREWSAK